MDGDKEVGSSSGFKSDKPSFETTSTPAPPTPSAPPAPGAVAGGGNDDHKVMAVVGYIVPILFFVPLLSEKSKKNAYAMHHANQQLNLLIFWVVVNVVLAIPVIGLIAYPFLTIFGLVLIVMGIMHAAKGNTKELPLLGKYKLIK